MNRRHFIATAAAVSMPSVVAAAARAATGEPAASEYPGEIVREGIAPGAALIASRRGSIKLQRVAGTFCRIGNREAVLAMDTLHPLYSFSKLITATMVAMARTERLLDYGDLISKHIPEFKGGGKESITIRHCLTHSAGLAKPASKPARDVEGWGLALESLCSATVEWEPGSRTAYHGWSGAFLAAECVRRVSGGKPWARLCHERLFEPLGASSLSFDLPASDANAAIVPQPPSDKPVPATAEAAFGYAGHPGAGCFGTLGDALKVLQFHLQEGVWKTRRMIARDTFKEMHTVQYAKEIAAAQAAGQSPKHESWGLGPLLRGAGPSNGSHKWFGFANQPEPGIFGHAGIDTLIGVADMRRRVALVFATTNSPKPSEKTTVVRNKITDLVLKELG